MPQSSAFAFPPVPPYNNRSSSTPINGECMSKRFVVLVGITLLASLNVTAQDLTADAQRLMDRADTKRAFDYIDAHKDQILAEWIRLTEINAPSGKEHKRAFDYIDAHKDQILAEWIRLAEINAPSGKEH